MQNPPANQAAIHALPITDIKDQLYQWIAKTPSTDARAGTAEQIQIAYAQDGGWEPWAQVEIANLITRKYGDTHIVKREDRIYNNSQQSTDLVIRANVPGQPILQIIELKCERHTMGPTGISDAVQSDVTKLQKDLKPGYAGAPCLAVGISCTMTGFQSLLSPAKWPDYGCEFESCGMTPNGQPIYVFWVNPHNRFVGPQKD